MAIVPVHIRYTKLVMEQNSGIRRKEEGGGVVGLIIIRVCMINMAKYRLEILKPE